MTDFEGSIICEQLTVFAKYLEIGVSVLSLFKVEF